MTNPQDAGPHSGEGRLAPGTGNPAGGTAFPDKPILEWTEEDWARWIASPPAGPASPDPSPAPKVDVAPEAGASPEWEPEVWVELEATSEMDVWAELDSEAGDEPAVPVETVANGGPPAHAETEERGTAETERPAVEGTGTGPAVPADVADGTDEPSFPTTEERDGWVPEVEPVTSEPAAEEPFELDLAESDEPAVAAEEAGEPLSVAAEEAGQLDEPLSVAAEDAAGVAATVVGPEPDVGAEPQVEPVRPAERAEREWWEAVPPPLPPPSLPSDADGRDEARAPAATPALSGPAAGAPPAARPPIPPARAAAGRTPARDAPVTGVRPAPPRAQPVVIERSHRVRSALGLLGVAVLVGTIVAGLITVAIFAISVALRRAVG